VLPSIATESLPIVDPSRQPITLFTFFLELPHVLPISAERAAVTVDLRDEHWEGWSDDEVAQILTREPENPFPPEFVPGTRIVIRHIQTAERAPLLVAEEAFADWVDELFTESDTAQRRAKREEWGSSGIQIMKTVIALSRFVPRSAHPRGSEMTVGWLLSHFRRALSDFNGVLEALGFVLGRWDVGAVALRDLPAEIPVLIGTTERLADGRPAGITFTARIHDAYPVFAEHFEPELQPTEEAIELSNLARHGDQPFMLVFRFVHAAESERLAGDSTRAVIDLNTAVEVLISVTLNEGGLVSGLTAEELKSANQAGPKNKVKKYLGRMFDVGEIDIADPGTAWGRWFTDGYLLRNEALHEGTSLDRDVVERAFEQASEVIAEVKEKLEESETLKELGKKLAIDMRRRGATFDEELLGISFPWE
jgi:hypothetical protein